MPRESSLFPYETKVEKGHHLHTSSLINDWLTDQCLLTHTMCVIYVCDFMCKTEVTEAVGSRTLQLVYNLTELISRVHVR
jgi:hypothetical protein